MNYLRERVSYLKGLLEGMQISELTNEGILLKAIIDVMDDIALVVEDLEVAQEQQGEQIDALEQDLCEVENSAFDYNISSEYQGDDSCNLGREYLEYNLQHTPQIGKQCECEIYMIECPYCFEVIELKKEMFVDEKTGTIECPKCHEHVDVDWMRD